MERWNTENNPPLRQTLIQPLGQPENVFWGGKKIIDKVNTKTGLNPCMHSLTTGAGVIHAMPM